MKNIINKTLTLTIKINTMSQKFTEQQKRLASEIKKLYTRYPNRIKFILNRKKDLERHGQIDKLKTGAYIDEHRFAVVICLVEAENNQELNEWAEAIVKGEELLQKLSDEFIHEQMTPDFFKYCQYQFREFK